MKKILFSLLLLTGVVQAQTLDDILQGIANRQNQNLPMMLDAVTQLDSMNVFNRTFVYSYTLKGVSRNKINQNDLNSISQTLLNRTCTMDDVRVPLQIGVTIKHVFFDEKGLQILNLPIHKRDCVGITPPGHLKPNWSQLVDGPASTFYMDVHSVEVNQRKVDVDVKVVYKNVSDGIRETVAPFTFFCGERSYLVPNVKSYGYNGKFLGSEKNQNTVKMPVEKDTAIDVAYTVACLFAS